MSPSTVRFRPDALIMDICSLVSYFYRAFFVAFPNKHVVHDGIWQLASCLGRMPIWAIILIFLGDLWPSLS
jgi:hypothetical protein